VDGGGKHIAEREIVTGDSRDKIPTKWTKNEKK